jgi:integrating conjugative element protein (TIGR03756 family)
MKTKQTTQLTQIALICLLTISISTTNAKTFSTVNLANTALSEDCLDYCVDGACFWLVCSFLGCSVKTTPHINHNLPDFVISSYNQPGSNSFLEAQALDLMPNIQGGHLSTKSGKHVNSNLKFKEVSVIGNPVAYAMGQTKYLCNSNIDPYMPYYLSTLDEKMWRSGLTDMLYPSTWIPGMNEVSSDKNQTDKFLKSWGSLYPRIGFLNQTNEVRGASVIAARGLEVVNEGGARIYQSADCTSQDCMKPNGKWQMVSPIEENRCRAFGVESVEALQAKVDDDGQYGWTAWRNYGCCIPGPGMFIGSSITGCKKSQ